MSTIPFVSLEGACVHLFWSDVYTCHISVIYQLRPWVLEVNHSPNLSSSSSPGGGPDVICYAGEHTVKAQVVADLFSMLWDPSGSYKFVRLPFDWSNEQRVTDKRYSATLHHPTLPKPTHPPTQST